MHGRAENPEPDRDGEDQSNLAGEISPSDVGPFDVGPFDVGASHGRFSCGVQRVTAAASEN
jgi:hypothetical protein